jgi:hypothetical protein
MPEGQARQLRPDETALIAAMLASKREPHSLRQELATALVEEMKDGGMGSLKFVGCEGRKFGEQLAEGEFQDTDGVTLNISINADQHGSLFEMDVWKVDLTPLLRLPSPSTRAAK